MKGDGDSAYSVAMMLLQGRGVPNKVRNFAGPVFHLHFHNICPQDAKKAIAILSNLAQKARHPWACFSLAMLRLQQFRAAGYTDDSSEMQSVKQLLEHAANHKVAPAALNLSNCYFKGIGTTSDPAQGLAWLRAASRLGDPVAATQLGMRLTQGLDVEADPIRGFKLFLLAAESGYLEAVHNVGGAFLLGKGAPQDDKQARAFFELAASKGFIPSLVNLASLMQQGRGGAQDLSGAARLLQAAADAMSEHDPTRAQVSEQIAYVQQLQQSSAAAAEEVQHGAELVAQLRATLAQQGALLNAPADHGTLRSAAAALEEGGAQVAAGPSDAGPSAQQALAYMDAVPQDSGDARAAAQEVFVFESAPSGGTAEEVLQLELKLLDSSAAGEVLQAVNRTDMSVAAIDAALQPLVRAGRVSLSRVRAYSEAPTPSSEEGNGEQR